MNLLLDLGNSRVKWALADGELLLRQGAGSVDSLDEAWHHLPPPQQVLACSVVDETRQAMVTRQVWQRWALAIQWIHPTREALGVRSHYDLQRLGADRWAALLGARRLFPERPLLVVSAGTALVIDALTASGDFLGGSIQPGYRLMKQALSQGTARLPLTEGRYTDFPCSTDAAIETGCLNALLGAIQRQQGHLVARCGEHIDIILSGGDAPRLQPLLNAQVRIVDNLPLHGLAALAASQRDLPL